MSSFHFDHRTTFIAFGLNHKEIYRSSELKTVAMVLKEIHNTLPITDSILFRLMMRYTDKQQDIDKYNLVGHYEVSFGGIVSVTAEYFKDMCSLSKRGLI